ncbi:FUSC family protein [Hyphomicrobium sp. 99]|uniref:FUSC family protein n=1 Tax=Hyphomicrobium sp. 99 TaxID=1163419 RepID=UPI0005F765C9|nr:FUSC family protein [Hyphomicrobium sp. 99]
MSPSINATRWHHHLLLFDSHRLIFSLSSYLACVLTLGIAFAASLPRPWWAILTVYVTAQPMSGALRPKALYRLIGIILGALVAIVLVPNLQNSPELLVLCLSAWTGLCIYLAVLDRTPRAFLFQMAGFSAAVASFPYLDDPGNIFTTTISRVEEMTVAIAMVTLVHSVIRPWNVQEIIYFRAKRFLVDAIAWADGAIDLRHRNLTYAHRQRVASDVTELGVIAIHLPYDMRGAAGARGMVHGLQQRLAALIPLASAIAQRLDLLDKKEIDPELSRLIDDTRTWLRECADAPTNKLEGMAARLAARARSLSHKSSEERRWQALIVASLAERLAEFVETLQEAKSLTEALDQPSMLDPSLAIDEKRPPIARDPVMAALAGLAMAAAIILYCAVWILLAWPSGSATAAFAALVTCSFAAQEDPAPIIGRYLFATLVTFPIAAAYMFAILPLVDGYMLLSVALAPALIGIGYIQADSARSAIALPMFSCLIVGLGFVDSFQADFAVFANTGIAQVMGIVITIAVTRLFRSVGIEWTARRIIREQWRDIAELAQGATEPRLKDWTALALDRMGQIAARMALASESDALHAADGLSDIRVGRNILHLRKAAASASAKVKNAIENVLSELAQVFRQRYREANVAPAGPQLLWALDEAIGAIQTAEDRSDVLRQALLAAVGIHCNLFPAESRIEETKIHGR